MDTKPYPRKTIDAVTAAIAGTFGVIATLVIGSLTATSGTFTNLTATNTTSTRFMSATTSTFANNLGTEMQLSRTAVTTTQDLSNGVTCIKAKTVAGGTTYVTFDGAGSLATSTSPCSF